LIQIFCSSLFFIFVYALDFFVFNGIIVNKFKLLFGVSTNFLNKFFKNNKIAKLLEKSLFKIKSNKIQKENSDTKLNLDQLNNSLKNLNEKPNLKQKLSSIVKEELRYKAKIVSNEQVRIYSGHIFKFSMSCLLFLLKHRNFVRFESLHQLENKSTQKNVVGFIKGLPPSHLR